LLDALNLLLYPNFI